MFDSQFLDSYYIDDNQHDIVIKDFMTPNPICLKPENTIKDASKIFYQEKIDGAPVINSEGKLIGIFTKSHLYQAINNNFEFTTPVEKLMKRSVITIKETDSPETAWQLGWTMGTGRLPVVNEKNELTGIWARTDLVRAFERKLLETISQLNNLLQFAHNGIVAINKHGKVIFYNKAAERIVGIDAKDAIGKPVEQTIKNTGLINVLETGKSNLSQKLVINNTTVLSNRTPIIAGGVVIGAMAVFQDLSEIENIIAELENVTILKDELDAIIESSYDGIVIVNNKGIVQKINQSYEKTSELNAEDLVGHNVKELIKQGILNQSAALEVLKSNKVTTINEKLITGKEMLVTGSPVFDKQTGNIKNIILNCRDYTELTDLREKLEEKAELTQKYLSEIQLLRSQQLKHEGIVARSSSMKKVLDLTNKVADAECNVLILGETGVGKDIIAKLLHKHNNTRKNNSFIKLNCGAIPENLLESELFGYEEGAFTGSKKGGKPGCFELAENGTLFLDEIGDMPFNLQAKILNVLQDKEVKRLGGTETKKIDVRVIAATNQDLGKKIEAGTFRKDLYYRLNVVDINIPSLRKRVEDIPPLLAYFIEKFNEKYKAEKKLTNEALDIFCNYKWPGNIRELENVIERIIVTHESDHISKNSIPSYISNDIVNGQATININDDNEGEQLRKLYQQHQSTRKVSQIMGVNQSTVVRKMKKFNIKPIR